MASTEVSKTPPSAQQLEEAQNSELFDQDGNRTTFGDLTNGKRVVVIFVRHWWCLVCKTYIKKMTQEIPTMPPGTSVIVIGCGGYQPIKTYISDTSSTYPIYANPSLSLYKLFSFSVNLKPEDPNDPKEYTSDLGTSTQRVWNGMKDAVKSLNHITSHGPMSQNGGEMVLEEDGTCSFFHRMATTADHTDLRHLAKAIGAEYVEPSAAVKAREAEQPVQCAMPDKS